MSHTCDGDGNAHPHSLPFEANLDALASQDQSGLQRQKPTALSIQEELNLLNELNQLSNISPSLSRFKRKLEMRQHKRSMGKSDSIFDIDAFLQNYQETVPKKQRRLCKFFPKKRLMLFAQEYALPSKKLKVDPAAPLGVQNSLPPCETLKGFDVKEEIIRSTQEVFNAVSTPSVLPLVSCPSLTVTCTLATTPTPTPTPTTTTIPSDSFQVKVKEEIGPPSSTPAFVPIYVKPEPLSTLPSSEITPNEMYQYPVPIEYPNSNIILNSNLITTTYSNPTTNTTTNSLSTNSPNTMNTANTTNTTNSTNSTNTTNTPINPTTTNVPSQALELKQVEPVETKHNVNVTSPPVTSETDKAVPPRPQPPPNPPPVEVTIKPEKPNPKPTTEKVVPKNPIPPPKRRTNTPSNPPPSTSNVKIKRKNASQELESFLSQTVNREKTNHFVDEFYMVNPALIRTFKETLLGREPNTMMIRSPYSNRLLKPFIWRDYETRIQKALVMHQLLLYCNRKNQRYKCPPMKPIDYCYIQPEHIRQVNHLLCDTFWPGIDISDSLLTPDYTVVATYGKLVIGVALMTPIGYITYICVSPYWRRYKIATFMLYHLLQACPDKDITLHVSATNNAMLLYNQFGFKPEEYIIGFYSKYMPEGTEESKNAFLLRLRR